MDNKTISDIFVDVYNRFWMKWRDRVPPEDSGEWDVLRAEARCNQGKVREPYGSEVGRYIPYNGGRAGSVSTC